MNTQQPSEIWASLPLVRRAAADRDDYPVGLIRGRGVLLALQCTSALIVDPNGEDEYGPTDD